MDVRKLMLVLMVLAFAGCATQQTQQGRPKLDGQPWPTNSDGSYAVGVTYVLLLLDAAGNAIGGCVQTSSGNAAFDTSAMFRILNRDATPIQIEGVPAVSYVRVPIAFAVSGSPVFTPPPLDYSHLCKVSRLSNVSLTQYVAISPKEITITYGAERALAPGQEGASSDEVDGFVNVLVNSDGYLSEMRPLQPQVAPSLNNLIAQRLRSVIYPSGQPKHWEVISIHLRKKE